MSDYFFDELDLSSKAKQIFTAYYFKIFLNIITGSIGKYNLNKRVVYLDFFAGPGKDARGNELTPLKVIDAILNNSVISKNCYLYFNDRDNYRELEKNVSNKMSEIGLSIPYSIDHKDSRQIVVNSLFNDKDIVLSFVDSFGYMLVDPDTICSLIKNDYSDTVVFINLNHFNRFIDAPKEKQSFLRFFGNESNHNRFVAMFRSSLDIEKVYEELIKDYVSRLIKTKGQNLFCLPIFFRFGDEDTQLSHAVIVISKNKTGINRIRESFVEVDDTIDDTGKRNENFYLENEKIVVYENNKRGTVSLFGDENKKYYRVLDYLPDNYNDAVSTSKLLEIIDEDYISKNCYCSGYSKAFLRRAFIFLESNGLIGINYIGTRKRKDYTYGDNTRVYYKSKE